MVSNICIEELSFGEAILKRLVNGRGKLFFQLFISKYICSKDICDVGSIASIPVERQSNDERNSQLDNGIHGGLDTILLFIRICYLSVICFGIDLDLTAEFASILDCNAICANGYSVGGGGGGLYIKSSTVGWNRKE